jgi:hypothetical protein
MMNLRMIAHLQVAKLSTPPVQRCPDVIMLVQGTVDFTPPAAALS